MNLDALADFNRVAADGGFSRASRRTGRPKATLSRRVRELENALGVRLIERDGKRFRLTEDGAALYQRTADLLNEVEEAGRMIAEGLDRPRGVLRVSAPILFSHSQLGRLAADFCRRYPEVRIEAVAEDRYVDLMAESFDVAIRVNPRAVDGDLLGRRIMRDHMVLVATPDLSRPPARELTRFPAVVVAAEREDAIWHLEGDGWTGTVEPYPVMRLPSYLVVRDAVLAGVGVALLPNTLAADEVAAGRLASWGAVPKREVEIWALHTSRRLVSRKVQAFMDFLVARFAASEYS
ncbi:LysR substrate-binding domain-containing protein [Rhodoligotrophos ferricapiens]|uniref:LysR substrate-binding domain-containing protein n=1 Tax=Rhodoligotrophos ferricapiens TaxID=3069264 RepID=UPI00315D26C9